MADEKTDAEKQATAAEIKDQEANEHGARGNVHSEPEGDDPDQSAPPPLPN